MNDQNMSEDEVRAMWRLLRKFASTEMDQFASWVFATEVGDVYVCMTRKPMPVTSPDLYIRLHDEHFQQAD